MKLYEIAAEFQAVEVSYNRGVAEIERAFDAGEIDAEEAERRNDALMESVGKALDAMDMELEGKVDAIARLILNTEADVTVAQAKAAPFKAEAKRYERHAMQAENLANRLKRYVVNQLIRADKPNVQTPNFKVRRQINGKPSIVCMDMEKVPADYRIPQPDLLNNKAISDQWAAEGKPGKVDGTAGPDTQVARLEDIPGVEIRRGQHLRIT